MSHETLVRMFLARAKRGGDRTALLRKREGKYESISWNEVLGCVKHFALGLRVLGVKKGENVCLLSENRPEWVFSDLAILSLRAVNVPLYPTSSVHEIEYIVQHSESRFLIVSSKEQYDKVRNLEKTCPKLEKIMVMDGLGEEMQKALNFSHVEELGKKADHENPGLFEELCAKVDSGDVASIIYTSGTTGQPKGVVLSHRNFISNVEESAKVLPAGENDRSLSFLPLSHVFERMAGYYFMMYQGVSIAYAENMNTVPENLREVRPTVVTSVPRIYEKMHARVLEEIEKGSPLKKRIFQWCLKVGRDSAPYRARRASLPIFLWLRSSIANRLVFSKIKARLGGRIRYFISGGAPLSKEIAEFFFAADILILEGYGLTETSPVVSVNRIDRFRFGTVGVALEGVEVRIATDGEILVRGPNVMLGYFKNEADTREAVREGWFHTGDIGEFDTDGFLKITDRKKDLIITSGGKNIAPQMIENLLVSDPLIAQICVCGDRRHYLTALIVPDFTQLEKLAQAHGISYRNRRELVERTEAADWMRTRIDARCSHLAPYEQIKYFTLLAEEFRQDAGELTPTLKLRRKVVNQKYHSQIEAMYERKNNPRQTVS